MRVCYLKPQGHASVVFFTVICVPFYASLRSTLFYSLPYSLFLVFFCFYFSSFVFVVFALFFHLFYFMLFRRSFVDDVFLIFSCPADHVPNYWQPRTSYSVVVVVVVFTLTDRASTIPSNIRGCQSGTWSQRGTKVNGSHHGDNPLLKPTGIQIATKSYATLQAMAPTNSKTVHQTSFTPYREQPRSTRIVVAYPRPAFSATNRTTNKHVPTSFDQQFQVSQGYTSYKNKEK